MCPGTVATPNEQARALLVFILEGRGLDKTSHAVPPSFPLPIGVSQWRRPKETGSLLRANGRTRRRFRHYRVRSAARLWGDVRAVCG